MLRSKGLTEGIDELTEEFVRDLIRAAPLHDIGKIGIRDAVLNKPGRLSPEEFEEMKKHTVFGATAILRKLIANHLIKSPEYSVYQFIREWVE